MITMRNFVCAMLCVVGSVAHAAAVPHTLVFQNQRGSILKIKTLENHKITGSFTTAVASKTCPQVINQARPITGYMIGNAISFSVSYPACESVLSIVGNLSKDQSSLDTLSILNKQADNVTKEGPGARLIGHDFYQGIQ